jgi:hypothetical protein
MSFNKEGVLPECFLLSVFVDPRIVVTLIRYPLLESFFLQLSLWLTFYIQPQVRGSSYVSRSGVKEVYSAGLHAAGCVTVPLGLVITHLDSKSVADSICDLVGLSN